METSLGMNTHMYTRACVRTHPVHVYMCLCVCPFHRGAVHKRQIIGKKKSGLTSFLPSLPLSRFSLTLLRSAGKQRKKKNLRRR